MRIISCFVLFIFLLACHNSGIKKNEGKDTLTLKPRTVSIEGFWMDPSEITSNEYRQYPVKEDTLPKNKNDEQYSK